MRTNFALQIAAHWRWFLALAALLAITAFLFLAEPFRGSPAAPSQSSIPGQTARAPETAAVSGADSAMPRGHDIVDIFAARNWEPPPPPVVSTPVPPPSPRAPPLPFKFFGRIVDASQAPSFILTRGDEMITVRVGDRIEPAYLVDKFDGSQLHLVYLPLNIRQTIFVGNANE